MTVLCLLEQERFAFPLLEELPKDREVFTPVHVAVRPTTLMARQTSVCACFSAASLLHARTTNAMEIFPFLSFPFLLSLRFYSPALPLSLSLSLSKITKSEEIFKGPPSSCIFYSTDHENLPKSRILFSNKRLPLTVSVSHPIRNRPIHFPNAL